MTEKGINKLEGIEIEYTDKIPLEERRSLMLESRPYTWLTRDWKAKKGFRKISDSVDSALNMDVLDDNAILLNLFKRKSFKDKVSFEKSTKGQNRVVWTSQNMACVRAQDGMAEHLYMTMSRSIDAAIDLEDLEAQQAELRAKEGARVAERGR